MGDDASTASTRSVILSFMAVVGWQEGLPELWVPAGVTQGGGYRERAGSSPRSRARKYRTSSPSTWAAWRPPTR